MGRAAPDLAWFELSAAASAPPIRWDLWLPLAGGFAATLLVVLAVLADGAFRVRQDLALDGRYLRLAHRLEVELRDVAPTAAGEILERFLDEHRAAVRGLAILAADGTVTAGAGAEPDAGDATREIDLFLGRLWARAGGGPGGPGFGRGPGRGGGAGYHGIRTLRLVETEAARHRPAAERLLLPAAAGAGLAVFALAALGGRLLRRQQETAGREADRRRLEGLGRAGAGLAHQLRTPLATLKGSCQLLAEEAPPAAGRHLTRALGAADRMETLLGQLLDYARPPEPEPADVPLEPLWRELAAGRPGLRAAAAGDLAVRADPDHLRQILDNLIDNAFQASPGEAVVELAAARRGALVEIAVDDRGEGPGEDPERLFEPYVTGRAAGTGLGLPIARALAEAGGGTLRLAPRPGGRTPDGRTPGGGTRALLTLPAAGGAG